MVREIEIFLMNDDVTVDLFNNVVYSKVSIRHKESHWIFGCLQFAVRASKLRVFLSRKLSNAWSGVVFYGADSNRRSQRNSAIDQ